MSARLVFTALLVAAAAGAQARDAVLRLPVAGALLDAPTRQVVGDMVLRFGSASATGADLVVRDVQVDGSGDAARENPAKRDSVRPSDEAVCQRAFDDAMTRLVAGARKAGAVAIVGIVSDYKGLVVDDTTAFECHAGSFRAFVSLRAQFARSRPHTLPVPAKSGYAELTNLDAVPSSAAGKDRYAHFLTLPKPRAFAFYDDGSWRFWADDPDAMTKSLDDCARQGHRCWLYAVDDNVVWNADESRRIGRSAQLRGERAAPPVEDDHQ
jgi:hypothetical protein